MSLCKPIKMRFSSVLFVLASLVVASSPVKASECVPHESEPLKEPYDGYTNTGFRGAPEKDEVWFKKVREFRYRDGRVAFSFKSNPKERYESIETIRSEEGEPLAFVAYRSGCEALFDLRGVRLPLPLFEELYEYGQGTPAVSRYGRHALRLKVIEPLTTGGSGWRYVVLKPGAVLARSPHVYKSSTMGHEPDLPDVQEPYVEVRVEGAGSGIVREDTIDEVLAPEWRQVGEVAARTGRGDEKRIHLVALDSSKVHVFDADGRPVELDGDFDRVATLYEGAMDLISFTSSTRGRCRVFSPDLLPVTDQELPLPESSRATSYGPRDDRCPMPSNDTPDFLAVQDGDNDVKVFRRESPVHFRRTAEVRGALFHLFQTGRFLVEDVGEPKAYVLYEASGALAVPSRFEAARGLGCGFFQVQQDGHWRGLNRDGEFMDANVYPFSC
jgi:hypothetical protein